MHDSTHTTLMPQIGHITQVACYWMTQRIQNRLLYLLYIESGLIQPTKPVCEMEIAPTRNNYLSHVTI